MTKQIRIRKSTAAPEAGAQRDTMLRLLSEALNAERATTNKVVEQLAARVAVLEAKLNTYNAIFVNVGSSMDSMGFRESVKFMIQMLSIVKEDGGIQEGYYDENTTETTEAGPSYLLTSELELVRAIPRQLLAYADGLIESASEEANDEADALSTAQRIAAELEGRRARQTPRRR